MGSIQVKRGQKSNVETAPLKAGEPIAALDTEELFVGSGISQGKFAVGTVKGPDTSVAEQVALFEDTKGRKLKAVDKAVFLDGVLDQDDLTNINQALQNTADQVNAQFAKLPGKVSSGTAIPTGGADGDVYIQYK